MAKLGLKHGTEFGGKDAVLDRHEHCWQVEIRLHDLLQKSPPVISGDPVQRTLHDSR